MNIMVNIMMNHRFFGVLVLPFSDKTRWGLRLPRFRGTTIFFIPILKQLDRMEDSGTWEVDLEDLANVCLTTADTTSQIYSNFIDGKMGIDQKPPHRTQWETRVRP